MHDSSCPPIDVIVPVCGAGPAFRRCAASLVRHLGAPHRLVIVLDGPTDTDIDAAMEILAAAPLDPVVLRHAATQGFVASVNRALTQSTRDVVLLNSDTQVTAGWLEQLSAAAYSDATIATVTPFSNNATICSLPRVLDENAVPAGYDLDSFATLVAARAHREYPRLPTGVGACLYIKRRVLDEVGPFDTTFGLGYGEEVDFCMTASARGYVHVLDDATYIFHEGSRSFGLARGRRIQRAERLLSTRYPSYRPTIADFMRRDPLAGVRARVLDALEPSTPNRGAPARRRIVHVVHGWPPWARGGTEHYARWLALHQCDTRDVSVYARMTDPDRALGDAVEYLDHGVRVRLIVNNFTQRNPLSRAGLHSRRLAADFAAFLDEVRPDVVHVHHLAGHCVSLMDVARRRRIPIVYQVQDWWPLCARANMLDRDQVLCTGPAPAKCAHCLPMTRLPGAIVLNPALHVVRQALMRRQLAKADRFVMGSHFIATSYAASRMLPATRPAHVLPYGVPDRNGSTPDHRRPLHTPLRFGCVGAWMPHKGVHVAVDAFADGGARGAELHVWGSSDDAAYRQRLEALSRRAPNVVLHGEFAEEERAAVLRSLDVLIVPSIGLESYGLVAREAMAHGVPVLASRRGALTELFDEGQGGDFFPAGDVKALAAWIARLVEQPNIIDRWRERLPPVQSVAAHARELDRVYASVTPSW